MQHRNVLVHMSREVLELDLVLEAVGLGFPALAEDACPGDGRLFRVDAFGADAFRGGVGLREGGDVHRVLGVGDKQVASEGLISQGVQ